MPNTEKYFIKISNKNTHNLRILLTLMELENKESAKRKSEHLEEIEKEVLLKQARNGVIQNEEARQLYLNELKKGRTISIGSTTIYDYGIELKEDAFIFSSIKMFAWKDIKYSLINGSVLELKGPDGYQISLDLNKEYNVFAFYVLLNRFAQDGNGIRLSSVYE